MGAPAKQPLVWVIGDDEVVEVAIFSDVNGTVPVNITGRSYTFSVATEPGVTPVIVLTGVVSGASGVVTFTASDTQTGSLSEGVYSFDVVEVSGGSESTLLLDTLTAVQRVTV